MQHHRSVRDSLARGFAIAFLAVSSLVIGQQAFAQGTAQVVIGKPFIAAGTDPTKANNGWSLTSHGISENLFRVDRRGGVVPWLATATERVDDTTWLVRLRDGVQFSDGSPMNAAAVAAALSRTAELSGNARASTGALKVEAVDALTVRLVTERVVVNMASVLADWPMPIYRVVGDDFAFTGPYKVVGQKPGAEFALAPNPHYRGAAKRPQIRVKYFADTQTMALALQSGELDMAYGLPPTALPRIAAQQGLSVRTLVDGYMYLLLMNHARPPLDDVRVRRAVDLAVDRELLVKAGKGGKPARGLYSAHYPYSLNRSYPHDPAAAARLLDEAGWKPGGDGIRVKGGKRLTVTAVAVSSWPDLLIYLPVMRTQLAQVGIELVQRMTEAFLPAANSGDFDLLLRMTHTARAGDPTLFLNDSLRSTAVRNFGKYKSAAFDTVLAKLETERDSERRLALVLDEQRTINDELPLAPISEAPFHIGLSAKLADYEPWGADYYIIRDDLVVR